MELTSSNFRRIDRAEPVPHNIRSDAKICLLLVMAWAGQWKTEAFALGASDLTLIYRNPPRK